MSRASFNIAYDGAALRNGSMDVRDLAPALLAIGQLFDAANSALNHEEARVRVNVTATGAGSFEISFEVIQALSTQITAIFSGETVVAAINLKELIVGGGLCVIWLVKKLRGRQPDKVERLSDSRVRLTIDHESSPIS
jgi:hypothetical protein